LSSDLINPYFLVGDELSHDKLHRVSIKHGKVPFLFKSELPTFSVSQFVIGQNNSQLLAKAMEFKLKLEVVLLRRYLIQGDRFGSRVIQ
jgi:hypothetical protein